MDLLIFLLFIGLGIILFYLGMKFRDNPNISLILCGVGAFFILMSGLFVLTLGIDYKVGENISTYIVDNVSISDMSYSYSSLKGGLSGSFGLSYALFLLAFALLLITYLDFNDSRGKRIEYFEEED